MKYRRQHHDPSDPSSPEGAAQPHLRRRRKGLSVVPTLFTLGNCLCGFLSIQCAVRGEATIKVFDRDITFYAIAGYLIFAAMVFDMFDGFMARLTKTASDFGAELDSLADMVSFGVAPAYLVLHLIGDFLHRPGATGTRAPYVQFPGPLSDDMWMRLFWSIGAIYVCCTALRLARFNVINKHEVDSHMSFRGLPSPGAAAVVASTIIFFEALYADKHLIWFNLSPEVVETLKHWLPYLMPVVLLLAALLMVSRFAYAHLINRFLRGRRRFNYVVRLTIILLLVLWQPQLTALLGIYLYALSAPVASLFRVITGKKPIHKPVAEGPKEGGAGNVK